MAAVQPTLVPRFAGHKTFPLRYGWLKKAVDGIGHDAELREAAGELRANSKLTSSDYFTPVLGIIFLNAAHLRQH